MKTLFKTLIISLFLILECSAQGTWTMKTDKSTYSYGDSMNVSVTFTNNTADTISLAGNSCMTDISFNNIYFQRPCSNVLGMYHYAPGVSETWTWVLIPSQLGIPAQDGKQVIYAYYSERFVKDSIIITAPKYYGGRLDVVYKLTIPHDEIQKIRDSLKAEVNYSDTLKSINSVQELWQIKNYSVDSLADIYSKDSLFISFQVERDAYPTLTVTSIKQTTEAPKEYTLSQNYPNPFNPTTTISYSIPKASFVTIKIYDALGKEITTLVNAEKPTGSYEVEFDGSKLASGIYYYRMQASSFADSKKFILLK